MHRRLFPTNARVYALEKRINMTDAKVQALQANEALLETAVGNLITEVQTLQQQLATGIDQGDDDAISEVSDKLAALVARANAVAGASGVSGASGSTGSSGATDGGSGATDTGATDAGATPTTA